MFPNFRNVRLQEKRHSRECQMTCQQKGHSRWALNDLLYVYILIPIISWYQIHGWIKMVQKCPKTYGVVKLWLTKFSYSLLKAELKPGGALCSRTVLVTSFWRSHKAWPYETINHSYGSRQNQQLQIPYLAPLGPSQFSLSVRHRGCPCKLSFLKTLNEYQFLTDSLRSIDNLK